MKKPFHFANYNITGDDKCVNPELTGLNINFHQLKNVSKLVLSPCHVKALRFSSPLDWNT